MGLYYNTVHHTGTTLYVHMCGMQYMYIYNIQHNTSDLVTVQHGRLRPLSNKIYVYRTEIKPGKRPDTRIQNNTAAFGQRPRPLHHSRYTRMGTAVLACLSLSVL
jgi:hypothetical protein